MTQEHSISLPSTKIRLEGNPIANIVETLKQRIGIEFIGSKKPIDFLIHAVYRKFLKSGLSAFDCSASISITFLDYSYVFWVDDFDEKAGRLHRVKKFERLLSHPTTESEITEAANTLGNTIFKQIDFYTQKSGLRH